MRIDRSNQRREDGLSSSLQIGKAAEHIACADLILQGYNAFLADAGLPYDLVADRGDGRFWRVQVKSTCGIMRKRPKPGGRFYHEVYRFALRHGRVGDRRVSLAGCDVVACVAVDTRQVAYLSVGSIVQAGGFAPTAVEFKTRRIEYAVPVSGKNPNVYGRFLEDFSVFVEAG